MKTIPVEGLAEHLRELGYASPIEKVLLTRKGKPFALVTDASSFDEEDIGYVTDPTFLEMIAERRKQRGGVSLASVKARLAAEEATSTLE